MKNTQSADFFADRIDVITNFAVITNVVIKRVHYMGISTAPSEIISYELLNLLEAGNTQKK